MRNICRSILHGLMTLSIALHPMVASAEDIDIFTGTSGGPVERPNVLIVLDNTSNWARQSQQWPGGLQQGQAEVRSIKNVLDAIGEEINVGVMEFATNGTANDDGGFIRFPILQMTAVNKGLLKAEMDEAFNNINGTNEKRNSNTAYGNLKQDVYNYLAGSNVSKNGENATRDLNPPGNQVNADGYDTAYSNFKSPLSIASSCAKTYVIFIGNPNSSGPADDDTTSNTELTNRSCSATPIELPLFASSAVMQTTTLGNTNGCYASAATCSTTLEYGASEFLEDTDGDGDTEPVCVVTSTTAKGKISYDGGYMIPDGAGGYKSGCACTTPVADVSACAAGTWKFPIHGVEAVGATKYLTCTSNGNCTAAKLAAADPSNCTGNYSCSCVSDVASDVASCGSGKSRIVRTTTTAIDTLIGMTSACSATCSTAEFAATCATYAGGCVCGTGVTESSCPAGQSKYLATGTHALITNTPTGAYDTTGKGAPWHLDEWARCLHQKGVPVSDGDNQSAAVYTIDVYNKQPNQDHTALLMSAARVGGGKYFSATNEAALTNALKQIFAEIQSVNSTFASASLPVNATNRAQNENQVFIGMFRPDPATQPRWFGNLKRYQLVFEDDGVTVNLGDKNGLVAVNNQTGFIGDCAVSYWTTDSLLDPTDPSKGYYWANVPVSPHPASKCGGLDPAKVYSDSPDGPTVEKGAIAEVIRKGNNPPTTDAAPTWTPNRTLYTTASAFATALTAFSTAPTLDATQKSWASGADTQNEDLDTSISETRASLHGDVVHSRPLPVTYGSGDGVVYYGSNDGMFRAIDAETGNELWALMPYEFAQPGFVDRLRENVPLIKYPGTDMTITPTPTSKTYAWDGSIGIAQDIANTKVWIYPTLRRGGQMVYALNVTNKTSPSIMWKHGCYGGACTTGFENMGQSWSVPVIAPVAGYATEKVALFGGGYDVCEDQDSAAPTCGATPKGANVYAVDAGSGLLLKTFPTDRSVASEVSIVDMEGDGKADYGYVGDTGGNIYRIDMVTRTEAGTYTARLPADWTIRKVATAGGGRKFLFQPALLPLSGNGLVYVAIGSGDREHPLQTNYPYPGAKTEYGVLNRFYVYLDDLMASSDTPAVDLNSLVDKTEDDGCDSASILPTSAEKGWFMNLNQYGQGEQTVTSALILAGQVVFSTNRPIPSAAGTCSNMLGEARGYWINLFNASGTIGVSGKATCGGNRTDTYVGGGLPPPPTTGSVKICNGDGNCKDVTVVFAAAKKDGGTSTPVSPDKVVPPVNPIRSRIYYKLEGVD